MSKNYRDIHREFTEELAEQWQEQSFTYEQTWDWVRNTGMVPMDAYFCGWLRDIKDLDAETMLNYGDNKLLKTEYKNWQLETLHNLKAPTHQPRTFPWKPLLIAIALTGLVYLLTK